MHLGYMDIDATMPTVMPTSYLPRSIAPPYLESNLFIPSIQSNPVDKHPLDSFLLHMLNRMANQAESNTRSPAVLVDAHTADEPGVGPAEWWHGPFLEEGRGWRKHQCPSDLLSLGVEGDHCTVREFAWVEGHVCHYPGLVCRLVSIGVEA